MDVTYNRICSAKYEAIYFRAFCLDNLRYSIRIINSL